MKQLTEPECNTQAPHRRSWWLALILGALSSFGPLSIDMYLPALPQLAADFAASPSLAQLSLTACLFGIAAGQLIAGPISDVTGRRPPLLGGVALYVLASFACVWAPNIMVFIALRFMQGLSSSAGIVISRAIVRDLHTGPELTRFYAMLMLVHGVAPIVAPIMGGQVLMFSDWHGVFAVLTMIGAVMLLAVFFGLRESLPPEKRLPGGIKNTRRAFQNLLGNRRFMGYACAQGFIYAGLFSYISGSPFVLQTMYGVTPQEFSLIFGINAVGVIIAGQITGRLAGKVPEERMLAAGLMLALGGGGALLFNTLTGSSMYGITLPLFVTVSSVGIVATSTFALAMQDQGKNAGAAAALIGVMSFILGGTMAPLVGIGGSHTAVPMGSMIAASALCASLSYYFFVRER